MKIEIKNIIGSSNAISQSDGFAVYKVLEKGNLNNDKITIDFSNIQLLSTAFLNASIGRLAQMHAPETIKNLHFIFPKEKNMFEVKVNKVLENAILGDYFDKIVDEATS
ncbi:MAG: STAS-like domain-containing protein [Flavobacterium sp.]|uniref:STAS-like domain-containing protein n=1 Tax=Flavobacterium sp. Leaf359 TaxID=1736351 RepID=UPI0006F3803C|nr:DUF4325 domain-containing protein [Flavobacterium sp. Leaf359]KQS50050.1 hypothetical protein ASG38_03470 [Flavobacterium sp. Leaf359]MBU7571477.1 STAS-like domain-containing protein [Flavobacterium sp.]PZO26153.1 MAG: DUF4325 domain-containing protein [Flavobacteriaceae bacterium]